MEELKKQLDEIKIEGYDLFKQDDQLRAHLMHLEQQRNAVVGKLQALLEKERLLVEELTKLEKAN